jgi:hypothetical protein
MQSPNIIVAEVWANNVQRQRAVDAATAYLAQHVNAVVNGIITVQLRISSALQEHQS